MFCNFTSSWFSECPVWKNTSPFGGLKNIFPVSGTFYSWIYFQCTTNWLSLLCRWIESFAVILLIRGYCHFLEESNEELFWHKGYILNFIPPPLCVLELACLHTHKHTRKKGRTRKKIAGCQVRRTRWPRAEDIAGSSTSTDPTLFKMSV